MLRVLGACLLTAGAGAAGWCAADRLRRRVRGLRAMLEALELAERELSFRLTPMPELLDELSRRAPPPAGAFFACCRAGLDRLGAQSLGEIWLAALEECPMDLSGEDLEAVAALGQVLGRYDGEGQQAALCLARNRLSRMLEEAERDRDSRGRLYRTLGLTAGGFFGILLL